MEELFIQMAVEPSGNFSQAFTEADLEQIQGETFVQQVVYRRDLASTNSSWQNLRRREEGDGPIAGGRPKEL